MKIRWNELVLGPAKDPLNPRVFHVLALAAFFAWVGLGADGLSSSCYGPEEAFLELQKHPVLALPLAAFVALTVFILSWSYSILIEVFPSGGGGYVVATKLLGKWPGVVCGWALVLDYILTIAVSTSSAIDALFSFLPEAWGPWKVYATVIALVMLVVINLRGVKESILLLLPIFLVFLLTHMVGIAWALIGHSAALPGLFGGAPARLAESARQEGGWLALLTIFFAAFSKGAGTFTGIEAVSNSMQILREPRVATGKRTMLYMSISLAITAAGILLGYQLYGVTPQPGKTLNAVLFEGVFGNFSPGGVPLGHATLVLTLFSEGALLFVAAQAGFIGGPRTMAIMALDRWIPTRFANLSNRLVVQDGVLFMGGAAIVFVLLTGAQVKTLVILYSINVFVTFTLAQLGLCRHWLRSHPAGQPWRRMLSINAIGLCLSVAVLIMMLYFKFMGGGWLTLLITGLAILGSFFIRRHYEGIRKSLRQLDLLIGTAPRSAPGPSPQRTPNAPTAILLVGGFNGLGMHSFLTVLRLFPYHFKNFVFVSVGVVDYEEFKGIEELANLRRRTVEALDKYVVWARSMGLYAEAHYAIGTDLVNEIEGLAHKIMKEFPGAIFFGGQLVFENETAFTRSLHSQAAFEIQRRLQLSGLPMVLLPVRIRDGVSGQKPPDLGGGSKDAARPAPGLPAPT